MNCETFNDRLPEYLDETLPLTEQAAAREHVQKCGSCQQAVARHEAFAKSLRFTFNRETQGLSLSTAARQKILNTLKSPELPSTAWERLQAFCTILWRKPAWAGLTLLCLLLVLVGNRLYRQSVERSSRQTSAHAAGDVYIIDVPMEAEVHIYRRQDNRVVDAVVTGVSVINARFSENLSLSSSLKPHASQN